jgi:hypothetical protein
MSLSDTLNTGSAVLPGIVSGIYGNLPHTENAQYVIALENKDLC